MVIMMMDDYGNDLHQAILQSHNGAPAMIQHVRFLVDAMPHADATENDLQFYGLID